MRCGEGQTGKWAVVVWVGVALGAADAGATIDRLRGLPSGPIAPKVVPERPTPNWNWEHIPTSFHGAVMDREYTNTEVARLAQYLMITTEKWYTPCGSQGPVQSGPECNVEGKIEGLFKRTRALNPNQTTNLYWNSMFAFSFYGSYQRMLDLEASGVPVFLRDEAGALITLCNDGDVYCNITNYDWTQPAARQVWIETVTNATATGLVDGIFADHSGNEGSNIGTLNDGQLPNQLCNGKGDGRQCYNFTDSFKASFNSWHTWATNYTQDLLARTTGGPVIQGPLATMNGKLPFPNAIPVNFCEFDSIRTAQEHFGYATIEARGPCQPPEHCIAAYLAAVEPGTYMHCVYNGDDLINATSFPEMARPLGSPAGPAVETPAGSSVWVRHFGSGTVVTWNNTRKTGTVRWAVE